MGKKFSFSSLWRAIRSLRLSKKTRVVQPPRTIIRSIMDMDLDDAFKANDIVAIDHIMKIRNISIDSIADKNTPPLIKAIMFSDLPIVEAMILRGADVNLTVNKSTPLSVAICFTRAPVVKLLLDNGAKVDHILPFCYRPTYLFLACFRSQILTGGRGINESLEIVKELLNNGASTDIKNASGQTALDIAREIGFHKAADIIEEDAVGKRWSPLRSAWCCAVFLASEVQTHHAEKKGQELFHGNKVGNLR